MNDTDNMLSLLAKLTPTDDKTVARKIADDFRKRRIEKDMTREMVALKSGVALANIVRFERTAQISLKNLIGLAYALGYTVEIQNILATPKFDTMEELTQIRRNMGKTKAYGKRKKIQK